MGLILTKARISIKESIRQELLKASNFSCSICGKIPVIIHHIEEYAKNLSNGEKYLIPICRECHDKIHGKGGSVFSKKELYQYKKKPVAPQILRDKYHLARRQNYSFFEGSNFVSDGTKAHFLGIVTIDVSDGNFKLSILDGIHDGKPHYLIHDNELLVDTSNISRMQYSGPSVKIWGHRNGKDTVLIDVMILSETIIVRSLNAEFNGQPVRIYKMRSPRERQLSKVHSWMQEAEKYYRKTCKQIDSQPQITKPFNGFDIDSQLKQLRKDIVKRDLEQWLGKLMEDNFGWNWHYRHHVLDMVFQQSTIFRHKHHPMLNSSPEIDKMHKKIIRLRKKYKKYFQELQDVVAERSGSIFSGNMII